MPLMRLEGQMADDNPNLPPAPVVAPVVAAPVSAPAPVAGPEVFSREYVAELRGENKGLRLKANQEQQAREASDAAAIAAKAEAEAVKVANKAEADAAVAAANTTADERIIRAELRTVAIKAGMTDLDGLKMADLSSVKLNEAGEVEGADALMTALKESKPYLFGKSPTGTSNTDLPPNPTPPGAKPLKEMTKAEYDAAKKAAIRS